MEASEIMKMVEHAFLYHFFIIYVIECDNDRTIQTLLKYPPIVVRGQIMNSSEGNLMKKPQCHLSLQIPPIT